MKTFFFLFFISSIAYSQGNSYAMDTTIHKDEYYELVYQLNQCRAKIDSLELENRIFDWKLIGCEHSLSDYKKHLSSLEKRIRRKKKLYVKEDIFTY